jgi:competence ComEA-like helix-hairpin-helix protein
MAIILWCVVSAMLVAFGAGPIAGVLVVLPFVFIAPGLVVVLLLRLRGLALTSTVVVLVGLALGVLVPAVFLYTGTWSPRGAFAVIAAGTVLGASAGVIFDARRSRNGKTARVPTSRRHLAENDFVMRHYGGDTISKSEDDIAGAGGPTAEAHRDTVNLAAPIADDVRVAAPARAATRAATAATSSVDLNTVTLEQLQDLPGVGPSTAQKILDLRHAIDDAIAAAGGPTLKAQLDTVNPAAPTADGGQVADPARGATRAAAAATGLVDLNTATLEQLQALPGVGPLTAQKILDLRQAIDNAIAAAGGAVVPARVPAVAPPQAASPTTVGSSPTPPVDLNTATLEQLEALPGVGALTAQKILDFRRTRGPFHSVTELQDVPGIGPAHLEKLKGLVIT